GDKAEFAEFKRLIERKIELSEKRTELLRNSAKKEPVIGKLVCSCNSVGKGNLQNAIAEGYNTLPKLCEKTGAGTACGSCKPELKELLRQGVKKPLPIPGKVKVNGSHQKKGLLASIFR
ncbi:MAG: (2Fe-2S)-binding protein, partial [Bacteroidota bacterium]